MSELSPLASALVTAFEKKESHLDDKTLSVNAVVSEVATWYEKLRTAMDYREDEVVLRGTIERILKRRLLLGGNGETVALPLVRELLWARYFKEGTVPESIVVKVKQTIDNHLALRSQLNHSRALDERIIWEWTTQLLSADIEHILHPNNVKDTMSNFIFQILKDRVKIEDDTEETRDAQVYVGVRRAFAKDDLAFLRYHLFRLYFGPLVEGNVSDVARNFPQGYQEIQKQLSYPLKEKIYNYVKRVAPVFFILQDVFQSNSGHIRDLVQNEEDFQAAVMAACDLRYKNIGAKVRRAIIRSFIFILFTKALFAFVVEGTYERILFGHILWGNIILNTSIPPLLMVVVGLMIKTPGIDNSKRIYTRIQTALFEEHPVFGPGLQLTLNQQKKRSNMDSVFAILWLFGFVISFGGVWYILGQLHFTIISRFIFMFFITIVSFIAYRIAQTAKMYTVVERQGLTAPLVDFFFLPIVRVGRRLTEGIAQVNIFLFLFDFIFEAPFKGLFAFFEQWFVYLHAKREDLE